jgi:hypothetical protein
MAWWNPLSWRRKLSYLPIVQGVCSTTYVTYNLPKGNQKNHHCGECGAFVNPDTIACWRGHGL